jgi:CBS domain-containing protein
MQVRQVMTKNVRTVSPDDTIQKAASLMHDSDCGALPVAEDDRLAGIITDRDITLRAVANGKAPNQCKVHDVMSPGIKYVYEDEDAESASQNMSRLQVRRLPVLNRQKRLVGIVALADLATKQDGPAAGTALRGISRISAHVV